MSSEDCGITLDEVSGFIDRTVRVRCEGHRYKKNDEGMVEQVECPVENEYDCHASNGDIQRDLLNEGWSYVWKCGMLCPTCFQQWKGCNDNDFYAFLRERRERGIF